MILCEGFQGVRRAVLCNVLTLVSEGRITPDMAVRAYVGSADSFVVKPSINTNQLCGGCDRQTCRHARGKYAPLLGGVVASCSEGERDLQLLWASKWESGVSEGGRVG